MGLEVGDALQGRANAFVSSIPSFFFHVDGAEVLLGVLCGVPAAGRGRSSPGPSLVLPCGCRKDKSGGISEEQSLSSRKENQTS